MSAVTTDTAIFDAECSVAIDDSNATVSINAGRITIYGIAVDVDGETSNTRPICR